MGHGRDTKGDRERRHHVVQERLRTHLAVTSALAEAQTLAEAAPRLLEVVCRGLDWEMGALWRVDSDEQVIRCVDLWHMPGTPLIGFSLATRHAAFAQGEGLPGKVWQDGIPLWVPDIGAHPGQQRGAQAAREDIHAALALPVTALRRGDGGDGVLQLTRARARRGADGAADGHRQPGRPVHPPPRRRARRARQRGAQERDRERGLRVHHRTGRARARDRVQPRGGADVRASAGGGDGPLGHRSAGGRPVGRAAPRRHRCAAGGAAAAAAGPAHRGDRAAQRRARVPGGAGDHADRPARAAVVHRLPARRHRQPRGAGGDAPPGRDRRDHQRCDPVQDAGRHHPHLEPRRGAALRLRGRGGGGAGGRDAGHRGGRRRDRRRARHAWGGASRSISSRPCTSARTDRRWTCR